MSKKKPKTKITKAERIERQIKLLYKSLAEHRETEWPPVSCTTWR